MPHSGAGIASAQGRDPTNLPGGKIARVRFAPIATKFCGTAKWRDGPHPDCMQCSIIRSDRRRGQQGSRGRGSKRHGSHPGPKPVQEYRVQSW